MLKAENRRKVITYYISSTKFEQPYILIYDAKKLFKSSFPKDVSEQEFLTEIRFKKRHEIDLVSIMWRF